MIDAFCGTWKCIDSKNFSEYLSAIGAPPTLMARGDSTLPKTIFSRNGDKIDVRIEHGPPTLNNVGISFKLGEEFDEHTSDGRKCKSLVNLEGGKMVYVQKWDGKEASLVREIQDGKLITTLTFEDVVSVRTYEKV